ncbi:MAG: VOC family protein [Bacteroidota bacterium]
MKLSHVIYKVNDLQQAVADYRQQGFKVDYGSKKNPHNALIYFSEGPYIELMAKVPVPASVKYFLTILGKGKVRDRLEYWQNAKPGLMDLCLETELLHFKREKAIFKAYQQAYFQTRSARLDPMDRHLKWKMLFPMELQLPFLMTAFNINPKPIDFIHPNGIRKITQVAYGSQPVFLPFLNALCPDEALQLFVGKGMRELKFE